MSRQLFVVDCEKCGGNLFRTYLNENLDLTIVCEKCGKSFELELKDRHKRMSMIWDNLEEFDDGEE